MRVPSIAILALISGAVSIPVIAFASGPSAASAVPTVSDHAAYLAGTWSCTTEQNNDVSVTFKIGPDGTIGAKGAVTSPQGTGALETAETFHFDTAADQWTLDSAPAGSFGSYYGTASPWTGSQWTFNGKEPIFLSGQWVTTDVRQIFTYLGPSAFRREYQTQAQHYWHDISEEVCTKAP